MPGGPFAHVAILVEDLGRSIENWTAILEVFDPVQVREPVVYQRWATDGDVMDVATFSNPGGCEIQLITPVSQNSPMRRRLTKHGEGVHHLCFVHPDLENKILELQSRGIELVGTGLARDPSVPWQGWRFVAPHVSGGVLVELAYPYLPVQGRWEPGPA